MKWKCQVTRTKYKLGYDSCVLFLRQDTGKMWEGDWGEHNALTFVTTQAT